MSRNLLLTKVYNKLSGEEHVEAVAWAERVGKIIAEKELTKNPKAAGPADPRTYFKEVIERAFTRGQIVHSARTYWDTKCRLMNGSDSRIEAFVRSWNDYVKGKMENGGNKMVEGLAESR